MTDDDRRFAHNALSDRELLLALLEKTDRVATKSEMKEVRDEVGRLGNRMERVESCVSHVTTEVGKARAKADKNEDTLAELRGERRTLKALLGMLWGVVLAAVAAFFAMFSHNKG